MDIDIKQKLPLQAKEQLAHKRIKEFYGRNDGKVYVSFSGGKDSTVLLHLVRKFYPDVEAVFVDTGLEYPEIKEFVKTIPNVVIIRPKQSFKQVIEKYGYPVISKNVSRYVRDLQNTTKNNEKTRNTRLGLSEKKSKVGILSKKWRFLVDAPFKCSEQCCDIMKKEPIHRYEKETGNSGIIGTMASESLIRKITYNKQGCFNVKKNLVMPLSIWTENDIWEYIKKYNIPYSKIYDMGEKRTGCMFCMFGIAFDKQPNRFQRMEHSHPLIYKYCMEKLNLKDVLTYIKIPYTNNGDD
jgi:3'-phosphoadenosine 5'-phosphosulfate sulfotransferase (PAPS reductase)/FAD synthetase